ELRNRKSLRNISGQIPRSHQMPNEQRQNLVRRDERSAAVDRADAVAVAIRAETGVIFPAKHRLAQRFDMRLDRFRMYAAEPRVARSANFVARNTVPSKQFGQKTRSSSMHGIEDETQLRFAQTLPIHQFFERFEVRLPQLKRMNQIPPRRKRRHSFS